MLREIKTDADFPITAAEIAVGIEYLYDYLRQQYPNGCTVCGILTGSMTVVKMLEDHIRGKKGGPAIMTCFIGAKSYVDDTQKDKVLIYGPPSFHLFKNKRVVLIDDVIDSGKTMKAVVKFFHDSHFRPTGIQAMALCVKGEIPNWLSPDAVAYQLPKSKFIVGFGMDFNGHYRELTEIRPITEDEKLAAKENKVGDDPKSKLPAELRHGTPQGVGKATSTTLEIKEHQHSDTKVK